MKTARYYLMVEGYEYKNETYVKKVWHYKSGCCETLLIKYECNEGYYFKNKKRGS